MELTKETAMILFYIAGALVVIAIALVVLVSKKVDK